MHFPSFADLDISFGFSLLHGMIVLFCIASFQSFLFFQNVKMKKINVMIDTYNKALMNHNIHNIENLLFLKLSFIYIHHKSYFTNYEY